MKIMLVWRIPPGNYKPAMEAFLKGGGPSPTGVKALGRWHAPGSNMGWYLLEGDPAVVAQHVAEWATMSEIVTYPVIEDAEAASALSKVFGK